MLSDRYIALSITGIAIMSLSLWLIAVLYLRLQFALIMFAIVAGQFVPMGAMFWVAHHGLKRIQANLDAIGQNLDAIEQSMNGRFDSGNGH